MFPHLSLRAITLIKVDEIILWSTDSYDYTWDVHPNLSRFFGFLFICIIFALLIILYLFRLCFDVISYRKKKLGGKKEYNGMGCLLKTQKCIIKVLSSNKILKLYRRIFKLDSGWWCIKRLFSEILEISIQTTALLYYNGYILLPSADSEVALAYKPKYIKLFTVFLSCNCIFVCTYWLFYAFKPLVCHGFIFSLVLYSTDVIFDIFYTLFPLIVVAQETPNIGVALGYLQTDDQLRISKYSPISNTY